MNGETYQISRLTAEVKNALRENRKLTFEPVKYENRIEFHFLPRKTLLGEREEIAYDPVCWFEKCKKQGVVDVKMMMPTKVKERQILGFANTNRASIVTFLKSGEVHYWVAQWEFDSKIKMWNIIYTEAEWKDAPAGRPEFADNTKEFLNVLVKIAKFADTIGAGCFAEVFRDAIAILRCEQELHMNENLAVRPPLPEIHKPIFDAAFKADVFGAMGSWNDSPPYMAREKGLSEEYDTLSGELLTQIRLATLYAVNEW